MGPNYTSLGERPTADQPPTSWLSLRNRRSTDYLTYLQTSVVVWPNTLLANQQKCVKRVTLSCRFAWLVLTWHCYLRLAKSLNCHNTLRSTVEKHGTLSMWVRGV
uniref:Uncharacterized protein n=1 Tax=Rhipicephalus microplus TaxID=6941 RepID=A0A6G5AEX2_RHIMP